jgi:hypothetical protein
MTLVGHDGLPSEARCSDGLVTKPYARWIRLNERADSAQLYSLRRTGSIVSDSERTGYLTLVGGLETDRDGTARSRCDGRPASICLQEGVGSDDAIDCHYSQAGIR